MSAAHGIELIIFDLGRVLIDFDFKKVMRDLERFSPFNQEQIHDFFLKTPLWDRFERGRIAPELFFEELSRELKLKGLSYEAFGPLWNDIFMEKSDTIDLLRELRGRYRLAMLSNVNIMHWEFIRGRHDFMHWFDFPVASYETGHRKPDAEIFRIVLRMANVPASKAIFIDDIESHVEAAKSLGIRAYVFTDARQLRLDLADVLIANDKKTAGER